MKKILLLPLLGISLSVCAADWQRYDSVYIDNLSVVKTENSVQAWIIHPDFEKSKPINRIYMYEAAYYDAKCTEREMAKLNTAWYDKYHKLVQNDLPEISYIKIKPKTNNEIIFRALCAQNRVL